MSSPPGKMALEAMKKLDNVEFVFKKPEIPKKKAVTQPRVLPEEEYIEQMGKIIQRDFFPDLSKLKAQNEYLDAVEKNDVIKLREIYAKYSGKRPRRSPGRSPATFETPSSLANSTPRSKSSMPDIDLPKQEGDKDLGNPLIQGHTLDSFLKKYTSEDNESFQNIIETAKEKLKQRFMDLYKVGPSAITDGTTDERLDELENVPQTTNKALTYTNGSSIMFIPDGVDFTNEEKLEMLSRKQEISYSNTRLTHNPFNENRNKETITELAKTQARNLTGKIGVDGNILQTNVPQIRGFDFVKTPSPCPGECTPLMTWGEIEGTPFRLDGGDTPVRPSVGPSFRINETSRRETIALQLAEKAGERMRGQKQKAIDCAKRNIASPHIRSSIDRLASMSPAAKRLATMKLGLRTSVMTPSPRRTPSLVTPKNYTKPTPSPVSRKKTPIVVTRQLSVDETPADLTDDLLKIPSKRPKAADFF